MCYKIFILLSVLCWSVRGLKIMPCPNIPPPTNLVVADCDDYPCPLYKGETAKSDITFKVLEDSSSMKAKVMAKALGLTVQFSLPDPEVCHNVIPKCPLQQGTDATYTISVPVKKIYPKIPVELTVTLFDANNNEVTCFQLPCKVTNRKN